MTPFEIGAGETVLFWILGPLSVIAALGLLFARKSVHAALCMIAVMLIAGIFYIVNDAPFVGIIQIVVYSGAVMMLFLFVVMLVGVDASDSLIETIKGQRLATALASLGILALLTLTVGRVTWGDSIGLGALNQSTGNVTGLAYLIFGRYLWLFETTALLLVVASVAAMVLAHRTRLSAAPNQREWSERRIREGKHVAGLPVPGVYARHNAVDTPALLPDGTPSELSVSRVLRARAQVTDPERYSEVEHEMDREIEEGSAR
ncbi:MAG: NADH-quinone oxidoreductase subunit J [Actinomycetia bacterium]|nr:NADH-quinone oxidoreductase subunit J [Actinomycetes bacterium]